MSILTSQVGLSITENKVQLVEIIKRDDTFYLENVDEEYFEESLFEYTKEAKFIHILQNAYNELILRKPSNSNKISISIPTSYFKIIELPLDQNLTKNDSSNYIKWEISKLFPDEKVDFYSFQNVMLNYPNLESEKRILVYLVPTFILKRIHKFCVRNNLQLKAIDNAHTSSTGLLNSDKAISNKISVYIENNHLSILLFINDNLIFEKSRRYKTVQEIPDIVQSIIKNILDRNLIDTSIEKMYLFGNSVTSELRSNIKRETNIDIGEVNPFADLEINPSLVDKKMITEYSSNFSSATASSLRY